jgi:hypothetical protein
MDWALGEAGIPYGCGKQSPVYKYCLWLSFRRLGYQTTMVNILYVVS